MVDDDELLPLPELFSEVRKYATENGCDAAALSHLRYRHFGDAARDGRIPVERVNNRYHGRRRDVSTCAAAFGMVSKVTA
jgi:hypothetical protein